MRKGVTHNLLASLVVRLLSLLHLLFFCSILARTRGSRTNLVIEDSFSEISKEPGELPVVLNGVNELQRIGLLGRNL